MRLPWLDRIADTGVETLLKLLAILVIAYVLRRVLGAVVPARDEVIAADHHRFTASTGLGDRVEVGGEHRDSRIGRRRRACDVNPRPGDRKRRSCSRAWALAAAALAASSD